MNMIFFLNKNNLNIFYVTTFSKNGFLKIVLASRQYGNDQWTLTFPPISLFLVLSKLLFSEIIEIEILSLQAKNVCIDANQYIYACCI